MATSRSLVAPTENPVLERALADKLRRRGGSAGNLGELEPLALRLGLMQNTLKPRLRDPRIVVFAADHGIAVDGLPVPRGMATHEQVDALLAGRLPLAVFARAQQVALTVVDAGVAEDLAANDRLLARKIAHGTRNARLSAAMTPEQAHAAMRAGMEIGESMRGNAVICAGLGIGAHLSAALLLARLTDSSVRDLLVSGPQMDPNELARLMVVAHGALARHRDAKEPVEALAAFGGFETAMMTGLMLVSASKRHLLVVDGMAACAALMVAARIAAPVTDYCVFSRSRSHHGLDRAMALFQAAPLLELGMDAADGTGALLAWPLVRGAAALLTEVADGEEATPAVPMPLAGAAA